jgi:hypothetical protein
MTCSPIFPNTPGPINKTITMPSITSHVLQKSRLYLLAACACGTAFGGDWASTILTGDADSGINSGLTYTSAADFAGTATTINGVSFADTGTMGTNYSIGGAVNAFTGYGNSVGGSVGGTESSFFYNGDGTGNNSLTLSGLTVGQQYVTSWYNTTFGGKRFVTITPSDAATPITINEDSNIRGAGMVIRYAFTATATTQTYGFDAVSNGDSFHHYAFSNAVRNDAVLSYTHFAPVTPIVTKVSNLSSPFTPSNTDLLQTSVSSVVTTGNFNREPVLGGIGVLTDGVMDIGVGGNRPGMVTGESNSLITFTLNTTTNIRGYSISSISTFGGWGDGGRDEQRVSVYVSLVGSSDFILFGDLSDNPGAPGSPSGIKADFIGALDGVDQVRFSFLDGVENGFVGYGELDVIGVPTVPEPTTAALATAAAFGLARRRRQS